MSSRTMVILNEVSYYLEVVAMVVVILGVVTMATAKSSYTVHNYYTRARQAVTNKFTILHYPYLLNMY